MQNSRPTLPWMLMPIVRLVRWSRTGLEEVVGAPFSEQREPSDLVGALAVVGAITLAAMVGAPPLLTVGGGMALAVLFVVARSWVVAQEQCAA